MKLLSISSGSIPNPSGSISSKLDFFLLFFFGGGSNRSRVSTLWLFFLILCFGRGSDRSRYSRVSLFEFLMVPREEVLFCATRFRTTSNFMVSFLRVKPFFSMKGFTHSRTHSTLVYFSSACLCNISRWTMRCWSSVKLENVAAAPRVVFLRTSPHNSANSSRETGNACTSTRRHEGSGSSSESSSSSGNGCDLRR